MVQRCFLNWVYHTYYWWVDFLKEWRNSGQRFGPWNQVLTIKSPLNHHNVILKKSFLNQVFEVSMLWKSWRDAADSKAAFFFDYFRVALFPSQLPLCTVSHFTQDHQDLYGYPYDQEDAPVKKWGGFHKIFHFLRLFAVRSLRHQCFSLCFLHGRELGVSAPCFWRSKWSGF